MSLHLVVALLLAMDGGTVAPTATSDDELIENLELLTQLKDVEDLDVLLELDDGKAPDKKP